MKVFGSKDKDKRRLDGMSRQQKAGMIKRLESERKKINSEIEGILQSYAKESGNKALLRKGFGKKASLQDIFYFYDE